MAKDCPGDSNFRSRDRREYDRDRDQYRDREPAGDRESERMRDRDRDRNRDRGMERDRQGERDIQGDRDRDLDQSRSRGFLSRDSDRKPGKASDSIARDVKGKTHSIEYAQDRLFRDTSEASTGTRTKKQVNVVSDDSDSRVEVRGTKRKADTMPAARPAAVARTDISSQDSSDESSSDDSEVVISRGGSKSASGVVSVTDHSGNGSWDAAIMHAQGSDRIGWVEDREQQKEDTGASVYCYNCGIKGHAGEVCSNV